MLEPTINTMNEIGLEFMTITRFIPVGIGSGARDLILSEEQLVEAFRIVHKHNSSGKKPHIEFAEATPFCALPEELRSLANCCSYGYDRFYVDVTGELMVCGLSRIKLGGNVLEESINDIKRKSPVFVNLLRTSMYHLNVEDAKRLICVMVDVAQRLYQMVDGMEAQILI